MLHWILQVKVHLQIYYLNFTSGFNACQRRLDTNLYTNYPLHYATTTQLYTIILSFTICNYTTTLYPMHYDMHTIIMYHQSLGAAPMFWLFTTQIIHSNIRHVSVNSTRVVLQFKEISYYII